MAYKKEQHSKRIAHVAGSLFIHTDKNKDLNGLSNIRRSSVLEDALDILNLKHFSCGNFEIQSLDHIQHVFVFEKLIFTPIRLKLILLERMCERNLMSLVDYVNALSFDGNKNTNL